MSWKDTQNTNALCASAKIIALIQTITRIARLVMDLSAKYQNIARYTIGATAGIMISFTLQSHLLPQVADYTIAARAEVQSAVVMSYRKMIERDNVLLDHFMWGTWDRGCKYDLVPGELLADGSIRSSLIQICGGVETGEDRRPGADGDLK